MPIYEYVCESCGRVTEALQRMADEPLTVCPHCEGTLRKLVSAPAFQFKGSGWYVTDYAKKGGRSESASGGGDESKPAKAEPSTDSKGSESAASAASPATKPASSGESKD